MVANANDSRRHRLANIMPRCWVGAQLRVPGTTFMHAWLSKQWQATSPSAVYRFDSMVGVERQQTTQWPNAAGHPASLRSLRIALSQTETRARQAFHKMALRMLHTDSLNWYTSTPRLHLRGDAITDG